MALRKPLICLLLPVTLLLLLPAQAAFARGSLRVGVCKRDITPVAPGTAAAYEAAFGEAGEVNHSDPVWMAGFGNGRAATGYNDRLWARGVVIENRGVRVAIVSLDVVGYFQNEIQTIRALVSPASQVDYAMVASTHQHEGPDTLGIWGPSETESGIDFGYLDFVNATVAACIDDAAAALERARVHVATARSDGLSLGLDPEDDGFGVGDGKVLAGDDALAPDTEGRIVDPLLTSIQFTKRAWPFETIATLINFASHPESLGSSNTIITSDFPHYVRERVEAEYGGTGIWLSGDLGVLQGPLDIDVEDPATGQPAQRRTFRWAEVHGTQLAGRAIEAIDAVRFRRIRLFGWFPFTVRIPGHPAPKVSFATVSPVAIPLENPFFRFFIAIGVLDTRRQLFTGGVPDPSVGTLPPPFDAIPIALGEDIQTEVAVLKIGRTQIAAVPSELDPQIGVAYRQRMMQQGARQTLIVGLANDEIGYQLPTEKFDDSCFVCAPFVLAGIVEACPAFPPDCNTVFQNNVGPDVDPRVTEAFHEAVDALP